METEDAEAVEDDQKSVESSIDSLDSQAELRKLGMLGYPLRYSLFYSF